MTTHTPAQTRKPNDLWSDLLLVGFIIGLDVVARLLPHLPNLAPVAASALFVGTVLNRRALALLVPCAALLISDSVLGFDDWRLALVTYVASTVPALLPMMWQRLRAPGMFAPVMVACSLIFFVSTNFAVWAFSGMYPLTFDGLIACYVAALPFLQQTIVGDLLWAVSFFGGAWLVQTISARLLPHADRADPRSPSTLQPSR
jgi:hypothetical protein